MYHFAKEIFDKTEDFKRVSYEKEDEIEGEIRILTAPYIGVHWLLPHIKDFLKKYPKLTLQVHLNNEEIRNLGEADVDICPLISQQPELIQERLFSLSVRLFAHPCYLKEFGAPEKQKI